MPYVSITGLKLNSVLHVPRFWYHAIRSMGQAQAAPGNISADARTINGIHHTLTVWQDEAAMRAYLTSGAHLAAMRAFRGMATGKTLGFTAETPPGWDKVHALWRDRGRVV
jgi:quinol monooxygenase YgiN